MNKALYFPYIDVPNTQWTSRVLLYWDSLMSIVPMDYWNQPDLHSDFMKNLVETQLVTQVSPAGYIYQVPNFENIFMEHIEENFLQNQQSESSNYSLIHVEKMGRLPNFLVQNQLAFPKENHRWYFVRSDVAEHFMAYLATVLAKHEDIDAAPVTFDQSNRKLFRKRSPFARNNQTELHDVILRELLPFPAKHTKVDDLLAFKDQYGHLLPPFRTYVETNVLQLSQIQDKEQRAIAVKLFLDNAKAQSDELVEGMKIRWGRVAFGTLSPIIGAGISIVGAEGTLALVGAVTNLAVAAQQAISGIPLHSRASVNTPLAYVAHSHRRFAYN